MAQDFPRPARLVGLVLAAILLAAPARADDDCAVPMANWQPREAVSRMAAEHGWTVRRIKIDDGCYEIYAQDAAGRSVEIKVNPATLAILEIEQEHGGDQDDKGGSDEDGGGEGGGDGNQTKLNKD